MKISSINRFVRGSLPALMFAAMAASVIAQPAVKSVVAEPVDAFRAFNQWVSTAVMGQPEVAPPSVTNVSLALAGPVAQVAYQPLPVVLGSPELPLTGISAVQAGQKWQPAFNYQGAHMQQVVLNAAGTRHELRPMGTPLRAGERFKIRVTPTFDTLAEVDQVVGDAWYGQRTGQVYPQPGMSVLIKAGESVDLPIEANGYFWMNRPLNERLVIAVRDPRAVNQLRSDQPAYRQDTSQGSSYLQLIAPGTFAALEQLVSQAQ
jgi:hypothetical protein